MNSHTFSVSEVFPDGRVMIVTYVHIDDQITMVMDVYDSVSLSDGKRYMDVQLNDDRPLTKPTWYEVSP